MKTEQLSINDQAYILIWSYEFPHIDRIERIFTNPHEAEQSLLNIQREIRIAMKKRSRLIYPGITIAQENEALEKWDHMLESGAIDQKTYDYSMLATDCLCIQHWHKPSQTFRCACNRRKIKSHPTSIL